MSVDSLIIQVPSAFNIDMHETYIINFIPFDMKGDKINS